MSSDAEANLSENENTCVVCFKNVEIYSVGVCDHPVCYECSTRMRVLCRQNECPICRQDMPKVIFTKEIDLFSTLKPKVERMNLQDVKFGLLFCSGSIQQAYHRLLEHKCHLCSNERRWPFKNFQQLKDHMRKEHELFYCDLCVANVKIFTFERRCYNRSELAMHRRRGDIDNTSHRGHPLCEFCDTRYMDPDELFRHLRRDHYYCHFCDADGKNQYYPSYGDLRTHFLQEHYLCEEGDCKNEEFTSVFRTDIDLRAHVASTHSRHLSKSATKQARTLELEFTLAPRREQSNRGGRRPPRSERSGENEEGAVGYDNYYMEPGGNQTPRDSNVRPFVNSMSSNDFPSLGGACEVQARPPSVLLTSKITPNPFSGDEFPSLGSSSASQRSSNVTITTHGKDFSKISGNSRAPEVTITRTVRGPQKGVMNPQDFPALTSSANSTVRLSVSSNSSQDRPQSSRSNVSIHVNHQANGAITTKITTTPTSTNQVRPKTTEAFPALSNAPVREVQWVSQKPKRPPQEPKSAKVATAPVLPPSSLNDFPMLKGGKSDAKAKKRSSVTMPVSNTWVNLNSINSESRNAVASAKEESAAAVEEASKAKPKREAPKSTGKCVKKTEVKSEARVAERPTKVSEKPRTSESVSERLDGSAGDSDKGRSKKKRTKNNNDYKSSASTENFDDDAFNSKNADVDVNKNGIVKKLSHLKIDQLEPPINGSYHDFPTLGQKKPPPGFAVKPPPGFECANQSNMPVPNDLTFTNSSGQSFPILPASSYGYRAPPNFEVRNIKLADNFKSVLNGGDAVMEFINFSKLFRNGAYSAENYYEHCKHCLGGAFDRIFPELLVLLPDIEKQQDLYRLHTKDGARNDLDVCCTCNQVVFTRELRSHLSNHTLENNFPILPQSFEAVGNYWKK